MKRLLLSILSFVTIHLTAAPRGLQPPNIVWINCEDLDETLGCYGDSYAITPHLDALAKDSIIYRNAFANAPICAPARNCLITGMYPTSLGGQHLRCEVDLPPGVEPFPNILKRAGYFVSNYAKTDYNFSPDGIYHYWKQDFTPWRKRVDPHQPFFSFFVFGSTHEGPGNSRSQYEKVTANLSAAKRHDPDEAKVPAYFPNTPKMRELWARYYDLVSAMDEEVGQVIAGLKQDGMWENTIVWFFSDHGHGLPRHKRWLLDSGLRVPFMVRIPKQYQHLAGGVKPGSEYHAPVSFVDFAPTVLSQAGISIPPLLHGRPFLGQKIAPPRKYVYGARDRADDMFEVSRAVHDGRHIYIRHFLPHLPYLQGGRIFGNQKESVAELRRARDAGELDEVSAQIFAAKKPVEEFYDLKSDPDEIHNLINAPEQSQRISAMRTQLKRWIREHRDTGFIAESDYTRRARDAGVTVHEMAQRDDLYDLPGVLKAAFGQQSNSKDDGLIYQKIVQRHASALTDKALQENVRHANPSVAVAAAELACQKGFAKIGLPILEEHIASSDLRLALEAARAIFNIGEAAKPAVKRIEQVRKALEGSDSRRRYRDFNYASFTGWALEWALINCGAATPEQFE